MHKTSLITPESTVLQGQPAVCAIGAFDGVHLGHRYIIGKMVEDAAARGCASVIVTFDIDPDELFKAPGKVRKLSANQDRLDLLASLGADYLYVIPFTRQLAGLSCQEFLEGYLFSKMEMKAIHVGEDFKMGAGARSGVEQIDELCAPKGCTCAGYSLCCREGNPITSTRIRNLVEEGQVERASQLLGYPFFIRGIVVHGRGEGGDKFGIPTANIEPVTSYVRIKDGVYAGFVAFDGTAYPAAINAGIPPTFKEVAQSVLEPHIIDFDEDIYDREVTLSFTDWLRDLVVFESTEELVRTITGNVDWVRTHLSRHEGIW